MITKTFLKTKYTKEKKSVRIIAKELGCSESRVTYWLLKHGIQKRTISEAIYTLANPDGDPFLFKKPKTSKDWFIFGLGLGLFWGEGNKVNKHSLRLGNTDPALVKLFIQFLQKIYQIDTDRLRFGLQIFSDINPQEALAFWQEYLQISSNQFFKTIITKSTRPGTYKKRNQYGVVTVYFSKSKLRDTIIAAIGDLQKGSIPHLPS